MLSSRLRASIFIFAVIIVSVISIVGIERHAAAKAALPANGDTATCKHPLPCLVERNAGHGAGIVAASVGGPGILVASRQFSGVFSQTFNSTSQNFNSAAGVWGSDSSGDPAGGNAGVMGTTTYGDGVIGATYNRSQETGQQTDGVIGVDQGDGNLNVGVQGIAVGTAMLAVSLGQQQPAGHKQFPAFSAVCTGGSVAMTANNGYQSPYGDVMSLDCDGNMILKGTLVTNGTPLMRTGSPHSAGRAAYVAEQARPAIEDDGEALITGGAGYVAIDAAFAQAADVARGYSVFLTPEGPSLGLYVANKSAAGFEVRENPGGHASIGFAYRIVASPSGASGARLPTMASVQTTLYREAALAPHNSALGQNAMHRFNALRRNPNP